MESENTKLRNTMRDMVDDYTRQLELRDVQIDRFKTDGMTAADTYKNEALALREKVASLHHQLDMANASGSDNQRLRDECERLNRMLIDKDRMLDSQMNNQKTEWAEIYAGQKSNMEMLERENGSLKVEINHLKMQVDLAEKKAASAPNFGGPGADNADFAETTKRLKKRELECQALWDTLKDMKHSGSNTWDVNKIWQLLKDRSLHTKAARKLEIPE